MQASYLIFKEPLLSKQFNSRICAQTGTPALLTAEAPVTEVLLKSLSGMHLQISKAFGENYDHFTLGMLGWFWNQFEGLYAANDEFVLLPLKPPCDCLFLFLVLRRSGVLQVQP